jgi:hypothetical protein
MSKQRTPDDRSSTKGRIGQLLRAYYQAYATEELPPRLLALIKKLDEEIGPSAEQVQAIRERLED